MWKRIVVAWCGLLAVAALAWSQDAELATTPGPMGQEFENVFSEWKDLLAEMKQLKDEYRGAKPARRAEIDARYGVLLKQAEPTLSKLLEKAQAALIEAPQGSRDALGQFLLTVAGDRYAREDYEGFLPLAKTLLSTGYSDKKFLGSTGISAFMTGDFDVAVKCLKTAKENSALPNLTGEPVPGQTAERWLKDAAIFQENWKKEEAIRAAEEKAGDLPRVLLKTNKGDIELELFENEAPNTVANFISLVEKGFYNGSPMHRVISNFMAQGGDPSGTGMGDPGYAIRCECYQANHRLHFRGTLSMAHSGRDTGGAQFFIAFVPTRELDGRHTVFGRVTKGIEVLCKLQRRDPQKREDANIEPDKILEASVLRKRNHAYEPQKLPRRSAGGP